MCEENTGDRYPLVGVSLLLLPEFNKIRNILFKNVNITCYYYRIC